MQKNKINIKLTYRDINKPNGNIYIWNVHPFVFYELYSSVGLDEEGGVFFKSRVMNSIMNILYQCIF